MVGIIHYLFIKQIQMNNDRQTILAQIKMAVLSVDPAAEAILFVSRARGDSGTESDWDILILVDKDNVTWENECKFRHKSYDIEFA
jgi:predicted nucleotidyltransferase